MPARTSTTLVDVDGPVHVTDFGGPADGQVLVLVHGLASSHVAWGALADELTADHRVLAVDLPGHGRTPTAGRSAGVKDAAVVLARVLDVLELPPVTLVGHSMGAAASVLAAAASPGAVDRLVLLAPPLPRRGLTFVSPALLPHVALCVWPEAGRRALHRRLARRGTLDHVLAGLRLTCGSLDAVAHVVPALVEELEAARAAGEDPISSFVEAARSVGLLVAEGRTYREAIAAAPADTLVLHGTQDRVLTASGLEEVRRLRPDWQVELMAATGHSPHMEAPTRTARLLTDFLTTRRSLPAALAG